MSEVLHYLLAQPYELGSQAITATDSSGTGRATPLVAAWYRTLLAPTVGAGGAHDDPIEILGALESALGPSLWRVEMIATGLVRVTYLSTGTGTVTLTNDVRNLLGFASSTVGPLATNASATATYLPTHCVFAPGASDDGWQQVSGRASVSAMPDGTAYGWQDGRVSQSREITLQMLPRDEDARALVSAAGTNALDVSSLRLDPGASEPGQSPPWSVPMALATCAGLECGWTDRLPEVIAGTHTAYDEVYVVPPSYEAKTTLSIPGYDQRRDIGPLTLTWAAYGTVT